MTCTFWTDAPHPLEIPALAVFNTGIVLAAGLATHRQVAGTVLLAASTGLVSYIVGSKLMRRPMVRVRISKLGTAALGCLVLTCATVIGGAAGTMWALGTYTPQPAPPPYVAPPARTIQVAPCPSGMQITQRVDGTYVCYVRIPPDPGTGPTVAPPTN